MLSNFSASAVWTGFSDDLALAATFVTCGLRLGEHAGENLLFDETNTGATAG